MSPRAFTADETDRIRDRLHAAARTSFAAHGLRRTTVDDLARAAGISKGAFYRFHESKEALLVALLDEIEVGIHAAVEAAVRADPANGLGVIVDTALDAVRANPLLPVVMSPEGLLALQGRPAAELEGMRDRDVRLVGRVVAALRAGGVTDLPSERVLLGLLRSLVFVGLHRDEVGPDLVEEVRAWLKDALRR
ncbi:MAG: TetR/AcrR family transcriptional regulator [Acidimicrobiales bacterium]